RDSAAVGTSDHDGTVDAEPVHKPFDHSRLRRKRIIEPCRFFRITEAYQIDGDDVKSGVGKYRCALFPDVNGRRVTVYQNYRRSVPVAEFLIMNACAVNRYEMRRFGMGNVPRCRFPFDGRPPHYHFYRDSRGDAANRRNGNV